MKPFKYNYNNQSGMYRHKISLRKRVIIEDDIGQQIEDFEPYGGYWAMIKTLKADEINSASQEKQDIQNRFVIKWSKSLVDFIQSEKTSFELVYNGMRYDVLEAINDNELNETVTILAKERGSVGD